MNNQNQKATLIKSKVSSFVCTASQFFNYKIIDLM